MLAGLRERFERAQHQLGDLTADAKKKIVSGAKATDQTIRDTRINPSPSRWAQVCWWVCCWGGRNATR
jgi:hypothetical protein